MSPEDLFNELEYRIKKDRDYFHGNLPEPNNLAWRGYLAACYEWSLFNTEAYEKLTAYLPFVDDAPITNIFRGRE